MDHDDTRYDLFGLIIERYRVIYLRMIIMRGRKG